MTEPQPDLTAVEPHQCWYGDQCRHRITFTEWAAKHPEAAADLRKALQDVRGIHDEAEEPE
jgi:hypothetical protein